MQVEVSGLRDIRDGSDAATERGSPVQASLADGAGDVYIRLALPLPAESPTTATTAIAPLRRDGSSPDLALKLTVPIGHGNRTTLKAIERHIALFEVVVGHTKKGLFS